MKLHKFIQSTAAAAVASAMMLSIAMPVLAETWEPSDAQNRSTQTTGVPYEANDAAGEDTALRQTSVGGYGIAVNGIAVTEENKGDILKDVNNITGKLSYNSVDHVLTSDGRIAKVSSGSSFALKITIDDSTESPVDVKLNGSVSADLLEITGARNVTASTDVSGQTLLSVSTLTIACSGDLELINNGDSSVVSANTINLTSGGVMTLRGSCTSSVLGGSTATLSSGGLLTLENSGTGCAVSCGTVTVENAGGISAKGGVAGGTGTVKNCTGNVELSSDKNSAWSFGQTVINCSGSLRVTGSVAADKTLFSGGGETTLNCGGDLIIESTGFGQAVTTGRFTVEKAQNVKISGSTGSPLLAGGSAVKFCNVGSMTLENTGSGVVAYGGGFTVENAADVVISGKADDAAIYGGNAITINCTGSVKAENTGNGVLFNSGALSVTSGGKMNLSGNTGSNRTLLCTGSVTLNAGGALTIQNTGTGGIASCGSTSLTSWGKISVSGNLSGEYKYLFSGSTVTIECGDDLTIENAGTSNVVSCGTFTVKRAKDVTLGSLSCSNTEITCSGKVTAAAAAESDDPAVRGSLTYTQSEDKAYEVRAGADSESAEILPDTGEKGTQFTMLNKDYKYLCITPDGWTDLPDIPDPVAPDTDGSGSALGAVVAGAAIGGTVLFVGYEVVTDIILGDLLPEGTAVPVNRGQLAVQIWTNAGRPEPEHQPVFTDVNDAETAKAAQWCVEQGFLSAESGSFRPDSWTPKFRVIEVWKKAFPQT